jgi:hypothetical protein
LLEIIIGLIGKKPKGGAQVAHRHAINKINDHEKEKQLHPKSKPGERIGQEELCISQPYVDTYIWQCRLVRKCVDKKHDVK